jgi:uncharacterized protein HemX
MPHFRPPMAARKAGRDEQNASMSDRYDDDAFGEIEPRRPRAARSRSSRVGSAILLLMICGIVIGVFRQNFAVLGALFQIDSMQPEAPAQQVSAAVAQPADDLRQLMKDLQASLQQATDKLDLTQRQIASEQGERKLLSGQVAALSARVSALSASNASVATAAGPVLPKKKPIAPIAPPPR